MTSSRSKQSNLASVIGTAPMVSTYLIRATGNITAPAVYLMVLVLVGLPAYLLLKNPSRSRPPVGKKQTG